jgi:hypothetical protein
MLIQAELPTAEALVAELKLLRQKGLTRVTQLELPALLAVAQVVMPGESVGRGALIEATLRRAVSRLGGGNYGEAVARLFGGDEESRTLTAGVRRVQAAQIVGVSEKTFRSKHEPAMLLDIANQLLTLCAEQHKRESYRSLERRHPVESAMAIEWLRRFESYYRIWTPVNGIGNDLTAYRFTLFEPGRPYDRRFGTAGPADEGYSQEEQAEGYATFALYHYARFEWELRQFVTRSGGLWLGSDAETEQAMADSVYRISFHTPWNERDYSFLRMVIAETPDQELHGFIEHIASTELGRTTHQEWQEWVATCECTWTESDPDEYFPVAANHKGISEDCDVHRLIGACTDYCVLVDGDWRKVADWYHLGAETVKGLGTERLYREQLASSMPETRLPAAWRDRSEQLKNAHASRVHGNFLGPRRWSSAPTCAAFSSPDYLA